MRAVATCFVRSVTILWLAFSASGTPASAQDSIPPSADEAAATKAALAWLDLLDAGMYGQTWEAAAEAFQSAVTKANWEQSVVSARDPYEPFGARVLFLARYTEELPNAQPGEYFILQYRTAVSEDRTVVETLVPMRDPDGVWRVAGYFVRPE